MKGLISILDRKMNLVKEANFELETLSLSPDHSLIGVLNKTSYDLIIIDDLTKIYSENLDLVATKGSITHFHPSKYEGLFTIKNKLYSFNLEKKQHVSEEFDDNITSMGVAEGKLCIGLSDGTIIFYHL